MRQRALKPAPVLCICEQFLTFLCSHGTAIIAPGDLVLEMQGLKLPVEFSAGQFSYMALLWYLFCEDQNVLIG